MCTQPYRRKNCKFWYSVSGRYLVWLFRTVRCLAGTFVTVTVAVAVRRKVACRLRALPACCGRDSSDRGAAGVTSKLLPPVAPPCGSVSCLLLPCLSPLRRVQRWSSLDELLLPASSLTRNTRNTTKSREPGFRVGGMVGKYTRQTPTKNDFFQWCLPPGATLRQSPNPRHILRFGTG